MHFSLLASTACSSYNIVRLRVRCKLLTGVLELGGLGGYGFDFLIGIQRRRWVSNVPDLRIYITVLVGLAGEREFEDPQKT